jgi:ribosomal protein L37AE/L43A
MGNRITQRIYECSYCGRIPDDGEYMWHMDAGKVMCQTCSDNECDKEYDEEAAED